MSKVKQQTVHIDDCECVYCGHKFDGANACNGDMDAVLVKEREVLLWIMDYVLYAMEL